MTKTPYMLIASISSLISNASSEVSSKHKSKLIGIDDVLSIDHSGKVIAKPSAQKIVSNWLKTVLPQSAKPESEYQFPTPAGTTWKQFVFEFITIEMLLLSCGQIQKRLEPEHLKMKNQKKELTDKLKQTFGLSENPLPLCKSEKAYKAQFVIKATIMRYQRYR